MAGSCGSAALSRMARPRGDLLPSNAGADALGQGDRGRNVCQGHRWGCSVLVCAEVLKGDLTTAAGFVEGIRRDFSRKEDGSLTARVAPPEVQNRWGHAEADRPGLWFFGLDKGKSNTLAWQPLELTEGYQALLAGRTPGVVFRALQRLDVEMQWEAMEELVAKRDEHAISALHQVALGGRKEVAENAVEVLFTTGAWRPAEFWSVWLHRDWRFPVVRRLRDLDRQRYLTEIVEFAERRQEDRRGPFLCWRLESESAGVQQEILLRWLRHPSAFAKRNGTELAERLVRTLAHSPGNSPEAHATYNRVRAAVFPALRRQLSTGVPEEVRRSVERTLAIVYSPRPAPDPPRYSDDEEYSLLMGACSEYSGDYEHSALEASAARELARHYRERVLTEIKADLAAGGSRQRRACKLIGYLDVPEDLALLVEYRETMLARHSVASAASWLTALARRSDRASHSLLLSIAEQQASLANWGNDSRWRRLPFAIGQCHSPRLERVLLRLLPQSPDRGECLLALAGMGNTEALDELRSLSRQSPTATPISRWRSGTIASTLGMEHTPEATALLKSHLSATWPPRLRRVYFEYVPDGYRSSTGGMGSVRGNATRSSPRSRAAIPNGLRPLPWRRCGPAG